MGAFTPFLQVLNPTHRPSHLPHASLPLPSPMCKAPFSQCLCLGSPFPRAFRFFSFHQPSPHPCPPPPHIHTATTLKNPLTLNYTFSPQGSPSSLQAEPDHPGPCPQLASSLLSSTCHNGYYFIVSSAIRVISPLSCKP